MTPQSITTLRSFYMMCLKRAMSDALRFFKLNKLVSWIKLIAPLIFSYLAIWLMVGSEGISRQIPNWLAAILAYAAWAVIVMGAYIVLAPYKVYSDIRDQLSQLRIDFNETQDARKPRLAILFEPRDTYLQGTPPFCLYRISIQNLSETMSVEAVSVELDNIKPHKPSTVPMKLHLMHDNAPDGIHQQVFDLAPGENRYVDVLEVMNQPDGQHIAIRHIVRGLGPFVADTVEAIGVIARGRNCPSVRAEFQLIEQNGSLRFVKL